MKKKNNRWLVFAIGALFVAGLLIILTAAASIFAYRQFVKADLILSPSLDIALGRSLTEETVNDARGVLVTGVEADSPAAMAGIKRGSVILAVNGTAVNSKEELQAAINKYEVGDTVTLKIKTSQTEEIVDAVLGSAGPFLGVGVAESNNQNRFGHLGSMPFADSFRNFDEFREIIPEDLPRPGHGERLSPFESLPEFRDSLSMPVIVFEVVPGTPADQAGLESGTIIIEANGQALTSSDQLSELIAGMEPGETTELTVQVNGETKTIDVTLAVHPDDPNRAYLGVYLGPDVGQFRQGQTEFESRNG